MPAFSRIVRLLTVGLLSVPASTFAAARPAKPIRTKVAPDVKWITNVQTDFARYAPGQPVRFAILLNNPTRQTQSGQVVLRFRYLFESVGKPVTVSVRLQPGQSHTVKTVWLPPRTDFCGYLVEITWTQNSVTRDMQTTAVDVSSDWKRFPRYGYLVDFSDRSQAEIALTLDRLNRYHLNGLQFYDWQWKHNDPVPFDGNGEAARPRAQWPNIANAKVSLRALQNLINGAHRRQMLAMNYNLLYGTYAHQETAGVRPEWGLFRDTAHTQQDFHPLPEAWASNLYLVNPANRGWQNYLFDNEKRVFNALPFDGFHIDQLGNRGERWDANGKPVDLRQTFAPFLGEAKRQLKTRLVMNAVSGYGQPEIAKAPVDFLYQELWSESANYGDLKDAVDAAHKATGGTKNLVIAAYMNSARAESPGTFNAPGVLLTDAVIFAAGGAHIELGDAGMLAKEYFPNRNLRVTPNLAASLRGYYDFAVAYENLLRDGVEEDDLSLLANSAEISADARPQSLWYFARRRGPRRIVHLINLVNRTDTQWRDADGSVPSPVPQTNVGMEIPAWQKVRRVWLASPDRNGGRPISLPFFLTGHDEFTNVAITVPRLDYWDMIVIEKDISE